MEDDVEIKAMGEISKALGELDEDAKSRVLRWAAERHGIQIGLQKRQGSSKGLDKSSDDLVNEFDDVASLYDAANPKTDAEKALVVGYWFQIIGGKADLGSQDINTQLKHLGHGVSNITSALTDLIKKKPSLVIQVQKSGKSKQARKKYKITNEGIKFVERKLLANDDES